MGGKEKRLIEVTALKKNVFGKSIALGERKFDSCCPSGEKGCFWV